MKRSLILMAAVFTAAITVCAQGLYIGPQFGYTVTVSTPDQVSQYGSPTRVVPGVLVAMPTSPKMEFRFGLGYRIENGGFTSTLSPQPQTPVPVMLPRRTSMIDVVDPSLPSDAVISTVETSTLELMVGMHFPVADLDTEGSKITIGLSGLADYMMSGSQVDDYDNVQGYTGEKQQTYDYVPHIGFGAAIGGGLILNMGEAGRLGFDLQYVFREPREIDVEQNGQPLAEPVNVSWLVGRGLRLTASYLFAL